MMAKNGKAFVHDEEKFSTNKIKSEIYNGSTFQRLKKNQELEK